MLKTKKQRVAVATALLLLSATLLSTASYAWFAMNTKALADNFKVEAYSDSLFLEISQDNTNWATSVSHENTSPKQLRLVTNKTISTGDSVFKAPVFTPVTGNYISGTYYKRADSDTGAANAYNYIAVEGLEPASSVTGYYTSLTPTVILSGEGDGSTVYYKKVNNDYQAYTPADGESLKELYNITATEVADADAKYDGVTVYWQLTSDGYSVVEGLTKGTDLTGCYSLGANGEITDMATAEFDGTSLYYVLSGDDYVCIGAPDADTAVVGYTYWGRAYSDSVSDAKADATLNVLSKDAAEADYYLYDTLYIKQAQGTNHAQNLKVSNIKVSGAANSLSDALRVLLVATSQSGEVATVKYDPKVGVDHYDASGATSEVLFESLLGDEQEVVTVEVYIYFDGTDDVAKNESLGVLNGQSVSIEFSIDELSYNQ